MASLLDFLSGPGPRPVPVMPQIPGMPTTLSTAGVPDASMTQMPNASPPQPNMPYVGDPHASFMDRLRFRASNAMSSLPDALLHVPTGMKGLLSDEDLSHARRQGLLNFGLSMLAASRGQGGGNAPGTGEALANAYGNAQNAFGGAVDKSVQANVGGLQTAQMLRILQARQQIGQQFAPKPGESRGEAIDRLMQMFHAYAGVGDTEMLGKLWEVFSKLGEDPDLFRMQHGKEPLRFDTGGDIEVRSPYPPYNLLGRIPKTGAPMSPDQKTFRQMQLDMMDQQQRAQREDRLVGQFNGEVKPITDATQALQSLYTLGDQAKSNDPGSGVAQQALMGAFIKLMHPNAIVRPGELKNYEDTNSLPDEVKLAFDHALSGRKLSSTQVDMVLKQVEKFRKQWQDRYDPILRQYKQRARQQQVSEDVFFNPFESLPKLGAPNAGGSANVRQFLKP